MEGKWCSSPGSLRPDAGGDARQRCAVEPLRGEHLVGRGEDRFAPLAPLRVSAPAGRRHPPSLEGARRVAGRATPEQMSPGHVSAGRRRAARLEGLPGRTVAAGRRRRRISARAAAVTSAARDRTRARAVGLHPWHGSRSSGSTARRAFARAARPCSEEAAERSRPSSVMERLQGELALVRAGGARDRRRRGRSPRRSSTIRGRSSRRSPGSSRSARRSASGAATRSRWSSASRSASGSPTRCSA